VFRKMEEREKEVPVSEDETVPAAEVSGEAVEEEASKESAELEEDAAELEEVEVEIEETLTRTRVISRLKAIVLELEGGSLVVGGVPVGELAESVDFELEYSEKNGRREIEIELKW
jgi:amphi-Trp domain-containing protein